MSLATHDHCCVCHGGAKVGDLNPCNRRCDGEYCDTHMNAFLGMSMKVETEAVSLPKPHLNLVTTQTKGLCQTCGQKVPPAKTRPYLYCSLACRNAELAKRRRVQRYMARNCG